jgi:hypothetical protein
MQPSALDIARLVVLQNFNVAVFLELVVKAHALQGSLLHDGMLESLRW